MQPLHLIVEDRQSLGDSPLNATHIMDSLVLSTPLKHAQCAQGKLVYYHWKTLHSMPQ